MHELAHVPSLGLLARPACLGITGLTGWEVALRFARPAPKHRTVGNNLNSTGPPSGIPAGPAGTGSRLGPVPQITSSWVSFHVRAGKKTHDGRAL